MQILPQGKKLYRGSSQNHGEPFNTSRRAVFFANSRNNASIYSGYVTEYTLTEDAYILNMGSADTIEWLLKKAKSDRLKYAIKKAFRISVNRSVRRFSRMKYDAHIAEFICRLGFDGYYAPRMRTKYKEGYFAAEYVICNPHKFLKVSRALTPTRPPNNRRGRNGIRLNNMNYSIAN